MQEKRTVGIFGGSFDPPTLAHTLTAEWVRDALHLSEIWFVPAGMNPFKQNRQTAPSAVRLEMLHAAIAGFPHFSVNDFELHQEGISYTVNTLESFVQNYPDMDFTLIIGSDQFQMLHKWHRIERILDLASVAVMNRPGYAVKNEMVAWDSRVSHVLVPAVDISSTLVRERCRGSRSIDGLVAPAVADMIRRNGLYRDQGGSL